MVNSISNDWVCPSCEHRYQDVSLGEVCPRDGRTLLRFDVYKRHSSDTLLGTCIDGRYRLVDILGKGGFGTVYRCFDSVLSMEFALKTIINTDADGPEELRERFLLEGRALAQLASEHVVQVYETGESNGILYMVLELIRGLSLKQHLHRERELNLITSARIVTQVLSALEHAHAAGLVHRDLKPSNILFTDLNATQVKLIDFGIAKSIAPTSVNGPVTKTGIVIGTVQYMAPEQLRQNLAIGPPADLYASGILFYQLLMGDTPFVGSQAEIAAGHLYQYPPSLEPKGGVPKAVAEWLQTALAKEPEARFPNAMTMRIELARAMGTPEENLNTTLQLSNDTIRMTPDLSFMKGVPSGTEANLDTPLETATTGALGSLPSVELRSKDKNKLINSERSLSLSSLMQGQKTLEEIKSPDGAQASTQRLTPVKLSAASQDVQSSNTNLSPKDASTQAPDVNNLTALADIPVIAFEDEMDKQERSIDENPQEEPDRLSPKLVTDHDQQDLTYPTIVVASQKVPVVDESVLATNPAFKMPASKEAPSVEASLIKTNPMLNAPVLENPETVNASLFKTTPILNVAVFQQPELLNPKRLKTKPILHVQSKFQQGSKPSLRQSGSFDLPYASAWWVLPFLMVLSVMIYFIWF